MAFSVIQVKKIDRGMCRLCQEYCNLLTNVIVYTCKTVILREDRRMILHDIIREIELELCTNNVKYNCGIELNCGKNCNKCLVCDKQNEKNRRIILAYLNYTRKTPIAFERKVVYSRELKEKIRKKVLPAEEIKTLRYFEGKFRKGESIYYNLSKGIFDGCRQDVLLNSWHIYHIHLNMHEVMSKSGMDRNRADYLLFCIITDSQVLFIDVIPHPASPSDFVCLNFLQIICDNNWNEEINLERVKGAKNVTPKITDEEKLYEIMGKANLVFELNGRVYIPLYGVVTSGHSQVDVMRMDQFYKYIYDVNNTCQESIFIPDHENNSILGRIEYYSSGKNHTSTVLKDLRIGNNS